MIAAMIARLPRTSPRCAARRWLPLFAVAALASGSARAELMPFEVPEEPIPWEELKFDDINAAAPDSAPTIAEKPVDNRPDWQPPPLDAYVDVSMASVDFSNVGYPDAQGGYRLLVGFLFGGVGGDHFNIAPEVGYTRIGRADRRQVTIDTTDPQYTLTQTDVFSTDLSSLDFGVRAGLHVAPRVSLFGRGGLQVYHVSDKIRSTLSFTPKPASGAPPRDSQSQRPSSASDSRLGGFVAAGIALKLGQVPTIYGEIAARQVPGTLVESGSIGVLLNF